ncbi:hypothetical protein JB92DRAFT_731568 [Gautieria morchelliformis]|nr:hypothetical protein JB92DRAFT_731568 [Gautieria morchelliformis]
MYISLMHALCTLQPSVPTKFVVFWNHLLASSIVVGSVALKSPRCVLAPSAISELEKCFLLFESAAKFRDSSARPARGLAIVSRLRDRAHQLAAALKAGLLPKEPAEGTKAPDSDHEPDELLILSGRGRLVEAKPEASPSQRSSQASPVRSSNATTREAGTAHFQGKLDAYTGAHDIIQ